MNTLKTKIQVVRAQNIVVTGDSITVDRPMGAPFRLHLRGIHGFCMVNPMSVTIGV